MPSSRRILAISDLHLDAPGNLDALLALPRFDDVLLVGGDVCETLETFDVAMEALSQRFRRVVWAPGNHELWDLTKSEGGSLGKYHELVRICRRHEVLTPEDEFLTWRGPDRDYVVAPLFILYDGGFARTAPSGGFGDDLFFRFDDDVADICAARALSALARLDQVAPSAPLILLNHYPLSRAALEVSGQARWARWSGTPLTEPWLTRYRVHSVIYGHLHVRSSLLIDGVRHENVSLGYTRDWASDLGMAAYLRDVTPRARC
jgi:hypothetical protein